MVEVFLRVRIWEEAMMIFLIAMILKAVMMMMNTILQVDIFKALSKMMPIFLQEMIFKAPTMIFLLARILK